MIMKCKDIVIYFSFIFIRPINYDQDIHSCFNYSCQIVEWINHKGWLHEALFEEHQRFEDYLYIEKC